VFMNFKETLVWIRNGRVYRISDDFETAEFKSTDGKVRTLKWDDNESFSDREKFPMAFRIDDGNGIFYPLSGYPSDYFCNPSYILTKINGVPFAQTAEEQKKKVDGKDPNDLRVLKDTSPKK
jgi:hypothetical protein